MTEYLFNLDTVAEKDVDGVVTVKPNLWLLTSEELPPLLFTPEEVSKILHVGRCKVYDLIRENRLRSIKVGGSRRIAARALCDFVSELEVEEI